MHVRPNTTPRLRPPRIVALGCLFALLLLSALTRPAAAENAPERYIFVLSRLDLPKGAPAELEAILRKQMGVAIAKEARLEGALPDDAPAYDEKAKGKFGNKPFHEYMKKNRLRAFKVIVQVTSYEPTLVPNPKKSGQVLGSSIILRMFGETIPDRVMAFSGDGSASVLVEVGKKVRDRDRNYADQDAADLAIEKAVAMSLAKLEAKPPKSAKKKKRRRKKR